nr:hypothetical protein BaRGS_003527 [Batillaria attramentaria]
MSWDSKLDMPHHGPSIKEIMGTRTNTMDADVATEIPIALKKLVRMITRGFYSIEHALVVDMLVRHPCIKEDDLAELLTYEKRHLRSLLNTLKNEKFLKSRMRVETDAEGRTTRHSYYFISYNVFVNIVKYKLDHIRKKIETEERNSPHSEDIMQTLLVHEPKAGSSRLPDQESSDESDEDVSLMVPGAGGDVEEMESDEEEDAVPTVTIGGKRVPFHDVSDDMVSQMTPTEKEEYIRVGQELYENMYE